MKKFTVYLEYWSANPGGGKISKCLGEHKANTFPEACEKALREKGYDMSSYDRINNRFGMFGGLFEKP